MTNMLILGGLAWGWLTLLIAPSVCGGLGLPRVSKAEMEDHTCSSVRVIFMSAFASFFLYRCRGDNCVLHGFCTVPQKIKGVGCNRLDSGPDGTQTRTEPHTHKITLRCCHNGSTCLKILPLSHHSQHNVRSDTYSTAADRTARTDKHKLSCLCVSHSRILHQAEKL